MHTIPPFDPTELRQHTSLFGQDTPTETLRLESCVKELRRVVSHSQMAIEKAMQGQQVFWARCVVLATVVPRDTVSIDGLMITTATDHTPPQPHHTTRSVEEQLPSSIVLDLAATYRKQMANPPALATGGSFGAGALAGAGMGGDEAAAGGMGMGGGAGAGGYSSPRRKSEGEDSALAQVVAQGAAAVSQEQQRVAVSEEMWASKQSPAKRDDACAIM